MKIHIIGTHLYYKKSKISKLNKLTTKLFDYLIITLACLSISTSACASYFWQQINTIAKDPIINSQSNDQLIYVGTSDGSMMFSNDGGISWIKTGLYNQNITAIAIDNNDPLIVYVGTQTGAIKTLDGGLSWIDINSGMPSSAIYSITIDKKDSNVLYAINQLGAFKTINGGNTWNYISALPSNCVYNISIDPINSQKLYAGTVTGVFKSIDGGLSWFATNNGIQDTRIASLAIDPSCNDNIYASTGYIVYKTKDGGVSWTKIYSGNYQIYNITVSTSNSNIAYATSGNGDIYKTEDGGASWKTIYLSSDFSDKVHSYFVDPSSGDQKIVAVRKDGTIIKTTNSGITWSSCENVRLFPHNISSFAFDPSNNSTIYISTFYGVVYKSNDGGNKWASINNGLTDARVNNLVIDPKNTMTLFAATTTGIYKTTNGGMSWTRYFIGLSCLDVRDIQIDTSNNQILYAATGCGVYKTTDAGTTWFAVNNGLTAIDVTSIVIDPINKSTLYAGTTSGIFKTIDSGNTWGTYGDAIGHNITSLAINRNNSQILFAGSLGYVLQTTNGGMNWNTIKHNNTYWRHSVAIDPKEPNVVYICVEGDGIYKSTDTGTSWTNINNGLNDKRVRFIGISPHDNHNIFAATEYALFKMVNTPSAPTINSVIVGDGKATLFFSIDINSDNNFITIYNVTSIPSGGISKKLSSPITITGLTNDVEYTFAITSKNIAGEGPASVTTNSVIPKAAVNGICGSSNGTTLLALPTENLCSSGEASTVTGAGPWYWSCVGSYGGITTSCSASMGVGVPLNLAFIGTGNGSVSGDISCISTSYCLQKLFLKETDIYLLALPDKISIFDGWLGDCQGNKQCNLTMDAEKSVSAIFTLADKARIGSSGYANFTEAYTAASSGSETTIMLLEDTLPINTIITKPLKLMGGYLANFSRSTGGYTTLQGVLSVNSGVVVVDRVAVM